MNKEIKRLLKLARIPGFKLTANEQKTLEEWKKAQEPVVVKAPKRRTYQKKTTNEVKIEEKETGVLEVVAPEES